MEPGVPWVQRKVRERTSSEILPWLVMFESSVWFSSFVDADYEMAKYFII